MRSKKHRTVKISITLDEQRCEHIADYADKTEVSRSRAIDMAVAEFLDKHNPNYKHKKTLENYHGSSKK